jgi:hypothetical protein
MSAAAKSRPTLACLREFRRNQLLTGKDHVQGERHPGRWRGRPRVEQFHMLSAWFELLPPRPEALQAVSVDAWLAPEPQVS